MIAKRFMSPLVGVILALCLLCASTMGLAAAQRTATSGSDAFSASATDHTDGQSLIPAMRVIKTFHANDLPESFFETQTSAVAWSNSGTKIAAYSDLGQRILSLGSDR